MATVLTKSIVPYKQVVGTKSDQSDWVTLELLRVFVTAQDATGLIFEIEFDHDPSQAEVDARVTSIPVPADLVDLSQTYKDLQAQYAAGITALDNLIASGNLGDKTLATVLKRTLMLLKAFVQRQGIATIKG